VPLRQSLAITGSLNQHGEVQPIGGVNEKIEGFYAVCAGRGLDGSQGVVIPTTNLPNLMLADEVVEAARAGRFAVWAVATIDEAIALLTGIPAGKRGRDGSYPGDSVNGRVGAGLDALAARAMDFMPRNDGRAASGPSTTRRRKAAAP
jgi:Lon-like ATP-dependent protease